MLAWIGLLRAVDRLAPGVLPPPATAAARALAPKRPLLWHTCASHPTSGSPCRPGCVMLCGARWRPDSRERTSLGATPDRCVVCAELAR